MRGHKAGNFKDMTGARFGEITVVSRAPNNAGGTARWNCVCSCGETRVIDGTGLRDGRHLSCGCRSPRFTSARVTTHGKSISRIYRIFRGMHGRCSDKATGAVRRNYFERGIRVCERWSAFENFLADMGEPPAGCTLDRVNNDGHYEPGNCRWATSIVQANNTRVNRVLTFQGKAQTVMQWAREIGIAGNTLQYRVLRGWSVERALTEPVQARQS